MDTNAGSEDGAGWRAQGAMRRDAFADAAFAIPPHMRGPCRGERRRPERADG